MKKPLKPNNEKDNYHQPGSPYSIDSLMLKSIVPCLPKTSQGYLWTWNIPELMREYIENRIKELRASISMMPHGNWPVENAIKELEAALKHDK